MSNVKTVYQCTICKSIHNIGNKAKNCCKLTALNKFNIKFGELLSIDAYLCNAYEYEIYFHLMYNIKIKKKTSKVYYDLDIPIEIGHDVKTIDIGDELKYDLQFRDICEIFKCTDENDSKDQLIEYICDKVATELLDKFSFIELMTNSKTKLHIISNGNELIGTFKKINEKQRTKTMQMR